MRKENKRPVFLAILLGLGICSLLGLGIQAAKADIYLKIGYVDFEKLFNEYEKTKDLDARLNGQAEEYQQTLQEKREEIDSLTNKLEEQSSIFTEETKQEKQTEIQQKVDEWNSSAQEINEELQRQGAEYTEEIKSDIIAMVRIIAEKEGYRFVFNFIKEEDLIYHTDPQLIYIAPDPELDLTEKVLLRLNEEYEEKK